ncbi:MAG: hypothetical protein KGJ09_00565 [Candidatus Omnitrophica bacterium]|nr:hypothetical protein [Candidatus Omnitrophota bacterium]MDE2008552.1 hypothetical protein [Candidatus Omnitrophota bacterium]MDE2214018.1 hypothetical protein [Candidatus Omnitrophota bacterium]MDE2231004.1 hypothetical protein [Candidatus Omnitrophota bacterium]
MRLLILAFLFLSANSVYAQQNFVYDDHGKRDPFVPLVSSAGMVVTYDEDLSVNDLVLEGIVTDASGNNMAIVNGRVVRIGDQLGPYTVMAISFDQVEFSKGPRRFVLKIKNGGT